jgi:lipid A 4'-phosphatase
MNSGTAALPSRWPLFAVYGMLLVLIFLPQPALDLSISGWFYRADHGFWLRDTGPMVAVYRGTHWFSIAVIVGLLLTLAYSALKTGSDAQALKRRLGWTLLALVIGPGLVVHTVFKDQWGRPRPSQIAEFGGTGHYVRPGVLSTQCRKNCSFVSGHAASGYFLIAGGLLWPARRKRWTIAGIVLGSAIGAVRIIQGGHFFSDVVGSLVVVWTTVLIVEFWAQSGRRRSAAKA